MYGKVRMSVTLLLSSYFAYRSSCFLPYKFKFPHRPHFYKSSFFLQHELQFVFHYLIYSYSFLPPPARQEQEKTSAHRVRFPGRRALSAVHGRLLRQGAGASTGREGLRQRVWGAPPGLRAPRLLRVSWEGGRGGRR